MAMKPLKTAHDMFYFVEDVMQILGYSKSKSYKVIKSLNRELSSMSDLDRLASNNPRRILDIREFVVSRELSPRIGFPPGETLIRFSMVRTGSKPGDPPIAWTTEYVNRS